MENTNEHGATSVVELPGSVTPKTSSVVNRAVGVRTVARQLLAGGHGTLPELVLATIRSEDGPARAVPPFGRISSVATLREHLQCAIELEHATLPPYLCARYSLASSRNPAATEVMRCVLVEESSKVKVPPCSSLGRGSRLVPC
jgi:hypothetical protein